MEFFRGEKKGRTNYSRSFSYQDIDSTLAGSLRTVEVNRTSDTKRQTEVGNLEEKGESSSERKRDERGQKEEGGKEGKGERSPGETVEGIGGRVYKRELQR